MRVELWNARDVAALRRAGRAAAETLAMVATPLAPGVSTADIDGWVRQDTARRGGRPSQLGYHGFPAAVCTSRNSVVCHGIPRATERLAPGDIVNVDVTRDGCEVSNDRAR
jgi:methionyl aminopeptidase